VGILAAAEADIVERRQTFGVGLGMLPELANAVSRGLGPSVSLVSGGIAMRAAKGFEQHIFHAGEIAGADALLKQVFQFGVVNLDSHGSAPFRPSLTSVKHIACSHGNVRDFVQLHQYWLRLTDCIRASCLFHGSGIRQERWSGACSVLLSGLKEISGLYYLSNF